MHLRGCTLERYFMRYLKISEIFLDISSLLYLNFDSQEISDILRSFQISQEILDMLRYLLTYFQISLKNICINHIYIEILFNIF